MTRRKSAPGSKAAPGALFGAELRYAREAMGLTQDELARIVPCDRSLIAHIEAGTRVPQRQMVDTCEKVLRTNGLLTRLWGRTDWYAEVEHPDWFQRFADLEAKAIALRVYQVSRFPGLLQTEDYARALFSQGATAEEEDLVEDRVAARMSRQVRYLNENGPLLIAILDESVLRRQVGSTSIMRAQCAHLRELARRPNIRVQILPFHFSSAKTFETSTFLLTMPDGDGLVYSESLDRGHFSHDPAVFARHMRTYDVLRADALSARESDEFILSVMEGYGDCDEP